MNECVDNCLHKSLTLASLDRFLIYSLSLSLSPIASIYDSFYNQFWELIFPCPVFSGAYVLIKLGNIQHRNKLLERTLAKDNIEERWTSIIAQY